MSFPYAKKMLEMILDTGVTASILKQSMKARNDPMLSAVSYYLFVFPLQCGQQPSNTFSAKFKSLTNMLRTAKIYETRAINIYVKYIIRYGIYEYFITIELNNLN